MESTNNNKTRPAQIKASLTFYYKHNNEFNEKRKEYGKEAARRKYNELRQDDEQRKKRNECFKQLRQRNKAKQIHNLYTCHELEILGNFCN